MIVSLFPSLLCLPLFKLDSGLLCLSIESGSVPQDAQSTGAVSFLIAETQGSERGLLLPASCVMVGKMPSSKFPKKLELKLILGEAGMTLV